MLRNGTINSPPLFAFLLYLLVCGLGVHLELPVQQVDGADTVVQLQCYHRLLVGIVLTVVNHLLIPLYSFPFSREFLDYIL